MVLPMTLLSIFTDYHVNHPSMQEGAAADTNLIVVAVFVNIAFVVIILWGISCCTLVGKRLLQSRAGRARTSFKVVRKQAWRFVMNLMLTDILRGCFTFFWALLLIVPGIIYQIRTFFYFIAIVCEGKGYRSALQQSKNVVKGQTWTVFWYVLGLILAIFLPLIAIDMLIVGLVSRLDERLTIVTYLFSSYLYGLGIFIFLLSSISFYAHLKKMKPRA